MRQFLSSLAIKSIFVKTDPSGFKAPSPQGEWGGPASTGTWLSSFLPHLLGIIGHESLVLIPAPSLHPALPWARSPEETWETR